MKIAEMNVRFDCSYICECGKAMMYREAAWETPRRRMACFTPGCRQEGEVFLEPVFGVELAPAHPVDKAGE